MKFFHMSFKDACNKLDADFNLGLHPRTYREKLANRNRFLEAVRRSNEQIEKEDKAESDYWSAFDRWRVADMVSILYNPSNTNGKILSGYAEAVKRLPQLRHELDLAEVRRREIEQHSRNSTLDER